MSIETLKLALEALERSVATCFDQHAHQQAMSRPDHFINQAIISLRQAIAEAEKQDHIRDATKMVEQEPYGYLKLSNGKFYVEVVGVPDLNCNPNYLPLHTRPQPNVTTSDMKQEHVAKTAKQRHEENT
jgi:hypothetical protein